MGNSKDDTELLLRFAKALDDNPGGSGGSAFSHIKAVWDANGFTYDTSVYNAAVRRYRTVATSPGTNTFAGVSGTAEVANMRKSVSEAISYTTGAVTGSEWVAETVYREMCAPSASGGTIWIYTGAYNNGGAWTTDNIPAAYGALGGPEPREEPRPSGPVGNPRLSRLGLRLARQPSRALQQRRSSGRRCGLLHGSGLVCSPLRVHEYCRCSTTRVGIARSIAWSIARARLLQEPPAARTTLAAISYAGRFPGHTEPYESPSGGSCPTWGRNTKNTGAWDLVKNDTRVAGRGF